MYGRIQDLAALVGRIGIAVVFLAYGIDKWEAGIDATADSMAEFGVPLPTAAAIFLMIVEVVGAILFIIGLLLPLVGIGFAVIGLGAIYFVQLDAGLMGGYDFELVLALAALGLGFNGGRISLDRLIFGRAREKRKAEKEEPAAPSQPDKPQQPPE
ncbi:DoxX family protein [Haloechinothrix sp. LS1_15]|uniref:DoxX family protein n=1 Tax=Haloechinothrix sp. LS1_15 TaxID=2652248 RepID=UPI00294437AB|nr:DoxX family protein [Haloechinothrix sp. LS1_15]MDV6013927.1 DoxX family protein [Haloechinothrix sp. LS1_15]